MTINYRDSGSKKGLVQVSPYLMGKKKEMINSLLTKLEEQSQADTTELRQFKESLDRRKFLG